MVRGVASVDPNDMAIARKYTWGLDLAGQSGSVNSLDAAGGVGGLLAVSDADDPNDANDPAGDFAYTYDGNGNVGQLVAWAPGYGGTWGPLWDTAPPTNARLAARYEYDPYGNPLLDIADANESGPYAGENPFRFSTKYWDDETGLGYWGKRYRDGERWISRDPIEERGGWNLYVYVENAPSNAIDPVGLHNVYEGDVCYQPDDLSDPASYRMGYRRAPCCKIRICGRCLLWGVQYTKCPLVCGENGQGYNQFAVDTRTTSPKCTKSGTCRVFPP